VGAGKAAHALDNLRHPFRLVHACCIPFAQRDLGHNPGPLGQEPDDPSVDDVDVRTEGF
jgi:hypothetical protein